MRKSPSIQTLKKLFALSGNVCAFPNCTQELIEDDQVIGEICHIEAANEGGERYNPTQTDEERAGFNNLILFCPTHHKITNNVTKYTVEKLQEIKAIHEEQYKNSKIDVTDELASALEKAYIKQYFVNINGNQVAFSNQGGNVTINQHFSGGQFHRTRQNDPRSLLDKRLKLKKQFENFFKKNNEEKIVVRDINNLDAYPDLQKIEGTLTWYRVYLRNINQDGLEVYDGHSHVYIKKDKKTNNWEIVKNPPREHNLEAAWVIGIIPYDWIENVDFDGEFFDKTGVPHVFINFKGKKCLGYKTLKYFINKKIGERSYEEELESLRKNY